MSRNKLTTTIVGAVLATSIIALSGCSMFGESDDDSSYDSTTVANAPLYGVTILFDEDNEYVKVVDPGSSVTLGYYDHIQTFNPDLVGTKDVSFATNIPYVTNDPNSRPSYANVTVSIGLDDAIDYLKSDLGKDIAISAGMYQGDLASLGAQRSVATDISEDLYAYYNYEQIEPLEYTLTAGPVIQTDEAVSAQYLADKATLQGLGSSLDPLLYKYDFDCNTTTYTFDSTSLMEELENEVVDTVGVPSYDSLTYEFKDSVIVVASSTELPCKLKSVG